MNPLHNTTRLLLVVCLAACGDAPPTNPALPAELPDEGYVGSAACAECHDSEHAAWYASYHRRMTQAASPAAILAPFEGHTPVDAGMRWELEREGDAFFATPVSPDGSQRDERMRVVLTTGSHHYQMYWLESLRHDGLLAMPFAYHFADDAWVSRRSLFLTPPRPDVPLEFDRWQRVCIKCHTTNGTPEHSPSKAPRVAEFGISCEACHGPGADHITLRRADPDSLLTEERIVHPDSLDHARSAMVCGQCHGIHPFGSDAEREAWRSEGFRYRPGEDLAEHRRLLRGTPDTNPAELVNHLPAGTFEQLFWDDGEVRVSGREYNGLVDSPCFQRGEMDCLSCHSMHRSSDDDRPLAEWANDQLRPGMASSGACTQCHTQFTGARLSEHTRHAPDSAGSDCLNCHMPYTTYGLTKSIRSHTITSPNLAATLDTGRPNACNLCHLDRSLGWTADQLSRWYGHERPVLIEDDEQVSAAIVAALSGDAGQRALIAWALGWAPAREVSGTGWMPLPLGALLNDDYDAVVRIALRTALLDPRADGLEAALSDPARTRELVDRLLAAWEAGGLVAEPGQREAVLMREDGSMDQERALSLRMRRNEREIRLAE